MLCIGETYNERKASILDNIKVCRELIREVNKVATKFPANKDLALEVIKNENQCIKDLVDELVKLEKWRRTTDLDKDTVWGTGDTRHGKE